MSEICPLIFRPVNDATAGATLPDCDFRDACAAVNPEHPLLNFEFAVATIVSDAKGKVSTVAEGPQKGASFDRVIATGGTDLLGSVELVNERFPVTVKLIYTHASSVAFAAEESERALYILAAPSGTTLLRDGQRLALRENNAYFIRPGSNYELDAGVLAIEVCAQRRAGRAAGADGFEQNGDAFDYQRFEKRSHITSLFTTVTRLISSPNVQLERVRFMGELEQEIPYAEPVLWFVLKGCGAILYDKTKSVPFTVGDGVLLPANLADGQLRTDVDCDWLEITLPTASDLADFARPDAAQLQARDGTPTAPMGLNIDPGLRKK